MNKREVYRRGRDTGASIASYQDLPEIGQSTDRSVDYEGLKEIKTVDDAHSYFFMLCSFAEENYRQYSPFEFFAAEINASSNSEELWAEYERGLYRGYTINWNSRKNYYKGE